MATSEKSELLEKLIAGCETSLKESVISRHLAEAGRFLLEARSR